MNAELYVDDGKIACHPTPAARKEMKRIMEKTKSRWDIKFQELNAEETFMLSANITRHSDRWTSIRHKSYIERIVKEHLPKSLDSYPVSWGKNPCSKDFSTDYEKALSKIDVLKGAEFDTFGSLVGALQYATNFRPDVTYAVGIGGRCRTFPTRAMLDHMYRVLVYLGRTADYAINYLNDGPDARQLSGRCDSDWHTRRSTTGLYVKLAGGAVVHASRRQHCIACSSTEAEMMAMADLALEVLYVRSVLSDLGHVFADSDVSASTADVEAHRLVHAALEVAQAAAATEHGPTLVGTDNKGAYDLCHRATVGRHSRHVERKVFKMRELRFAGKVKVELVPTKDNASDMLTKALDEHTFARHRDTIMNRKISES